MRSRSPITPLSTLTFLTSPNAPSLACKLPVFPLLQFVNSKPHSPNSQSTSLKAPPFQFKAPNISLTLSAGFTPEILIGISLFNGIGTVAAGVIFSLPTITATISQVSNVTSTCEPAHNSSSSSSPADQYIFNSLTHIVPKVDFAIALIAQAEVKPIGLPFIEENAAYTVWNKSAPLPTACFSYRADEKAYGAPTVSARSTTSVKATCTNTACFSYHADEKAYGAPILNARSTTSVKATGTNAATASPSKKGLAAAANPLVGWRWFVLGTFSVAGVFFGLG